MHEHQGRKEASVYQPPAEGGFQMTIRDGHVVKEYLGLNRRQRRGIAAMRKRTGKAGAKALMGTRVLPAERALVKSAEYSATGRIAGSDDGTLSITVAQDPKPPVFADEQVL
jgi:hypothetical protein